VVVENTAQPQAPISTEQTTAPAPADQPREEVSEVEAPVAAPAADASHSTMVWLALSAVAAFVGWLAYKFIFRKR
jgi:uncharacterized protein HemX